MYKFRQCVYTELQHILGLNIFEMQVWKIIDPAYINGLEIVETEEGEIIALIYYDSCRNENCEMFIMEFEVRKDVRRLGHGKRIIEQFLKEHQKSAELLPLGEESVEFV